MLYTVLTFVHFFVCIFLILVVLLQAGKGGGMGIAFGGGGSQTVFGSSGAGNFLTRLTAICAVVFFSNSLLLAYLSSQSDSKRLQSLSQRQSVEKQVQQAATTKVAKELEEARKQIEQAGQSSAPATSTPPAAAPPAATTPAPAKAVEKPAAPVKPARARKPAAENAEKPAAEKPAAE
jgi:preprotein translocase subunit SecG